MHQLPGSHQFFIYLNKTKVDTEGCFISGKHQHVRSGETPPVTCILVGESLNGDWPVYVHRSERVNTN